MARALPFGVDAGPAPTQFFPGLDQTGKLGEGAKQVYVHALDNILLPRLIFRLEGQMRQNFNNPAFLYQATKVYLMLGSLGPLDRNVVKAWMHFDWQAAYPGPAAQPLRDSLETPPRRDAGPAAAACHAGRRAGRGRAAHLQPRDAGGPGLFRDPELAAGDGAAALAAVGSARRHRRGRVHAAAPARR